MLDGKTIARQRSVQVMFDDRTMQTLSIDDETRSQLIELEGRGALRHAG